MQQNLLIMKRPSDWHGALWRTALPLGNGKTGVLWHGAVGLDTVQLNRSDLWLGGGESGKLPDLTDALREMRGMQTSGDYPGANRIMSDALGASEYRSSEPFPCPLGMLQIAFAPEASFTGYRRGIDMASGEGFVRFSLGRRKYERNCFVSRARDLVVLRLRGAGIYRLRLTAVDAGSEASRNWLEKLSPELREELTQRGIRYSVRDFGAVLLVRGAKSLRPDPDHPHTLLAEGSDMTLLLRTFAHEPPKDAFERLERELGAVKESYGKLLAEHEALHRPLYEAASLRLCGDASSGRTNEQLLDTAYDQKAPPALLERMWQFGRYLFISGTCPEGHPFPLYGLWHGDYALPWNTHVANENVEMIYWHALTGGLEYAIPPLLRYYENKLPAFRENARKLFGCRGIYVPAYTSLLTSGPSVQVPVILNWISAAGWLSSHFYAYYRYTGNKELLRREILPFLHEAALFYLDYAEYDENGRCHLRPSVSPENTPGCFMPSDYRENMGHVCPAVADATMDFAILRGLLHDLLEGMAVTGMYADDRADLERLLASLPEYKVNEQGAVREWMAEDLTDFYRHRHLSHLFPVFPGNEIGPDDPRLPMFERAVELRELGGQSGWSLTHMANLYARLGRGDDAVGCLDTLFRTCVLDNLFTVHNDWRHMGATLDLGDFCAVQLDAVMGEVSAIQELLFREADGVLYILPALPKRFRSGEVHGFHFPGGSADIQWSPKSGTLVLHATRDGKFDLRFPRHTDHAELRTGEERVIRF